MADALAARSSIHEPKESRGFCTVIDEYRNQLLIRLKESRSFLNCR
ncbi:hypothetical protein IC575_026963 [Cucumis melo]